jgi:hypothetical protein
VRAAAPFEPGRVRGPTSVRTMSGFVKDFAVCVLTARRSLPFELRRRHRSTIAVVSALVGTAGAFTGALGTNRPGPSWGTADGG